MSVQLYVNTLSERDQDRGKSDWELEGQLTRRTFFSQPPRFQLVASLLEDLPARPNDYSPCFFPRSSCKFGRLGEEAVARMHRVNSMISDQLNEVGCV